MRGQNDPERRRCLLSGADLGQPVEGVPDIGIGRDLAVVRLVHSLGQDADELIRPSRLDLLGDLIAGDIAYLPGLLVLPPPSEAASLFSVLPWR